MKSARLSIWPAAILAGITLFTFLTLRDYGPASAVRRFHEDALSDNLYDLQRVSATPVDDRSVSILRLFLKRIEDSGATPKWASMERSTNEVDILVLYELNGGATPFVWVVTRRPEGWQVNAPQTVRANGGLQDS